MEEAFRPRLMSEPTFKSCVATGRFMSVLLLLSLAGCVHTAGVPSLPKWDGPAKGQVGQVMALWADGVVVQPDPMQNGMQMPGLAARIYLFSHELGEPLAAEGSFIVYLYDDLQPAANSPVPREVWTLDRQNIDKLLKKDGLGWGYNLWLPWSNFHPDIRRVTLLVCYQPEKGTPVWSGQHVLPLAGANPNALSPTSASRSPSSVARPPSSIYTKAIQTTDPPRTPIPPGSTMVRNLTAGP